MRISTKGRYALRVMLDLAEHGSGEYIPVKDISERQGITVKYMEQIISQLNKAGYLRSLRGNHGGYKLLKSPEKYTVGEILRTIEGSLAPVVCLDDKVNRCERAGFCKTLPMWMGLYKVIAEYLDGITLLDILNQSQELDDSNYNI
ncbi:MAG: Rrf2 family transcriptional regulator [Candidatus Bathyarchaeota archaeon]|nr:Rrf2 family transcriptional regulator [Candidatus Termiticorpusculum sp.]